jgi:hypothetical protein
MEAAGFGSGQKPFESVQFKLVLVTHLIDNQNYIIMALFTHQADRV